MSRWSRRALVVLASLGLAAAALGGLWAAAAGGVLTRPLTAWAGAQLGRELAADGGLHVRVGRVTRVTATGLRVANAPWGTRPDLFRARSLTLDIDTRTLFDDTLVVLDAGVAGAELLLERNAAGDGNWTLERAPDEAIDRAPGATPPVVVRRLAFPGATIRLAGPGLAQPLNVTLAAAELAMPAAGMVTLAARGDAGGTPFDLRAEGGGLAALVAGRDLRFEVAGRIGAATLAASGRIDSLDEPVDSTVALRLDGPDAAGLARRLGLGDPGAGPFDVAGTVTPAPGGTGLRGQFAGRIGAFTGTARGWVDARAEPEAIGVQARLAGPDLALAGRLAGIVGLPAAPFTIRLDAQRVDGALRIDAATLELAEGSLAVSGAPGGVLDLRVRGADAARAGALLGFAGLPPGAFEAQGSLVLAGTPGGSSGPAVDLRGTTPLGRISAQGTLGAGPALAGTRLVLEASGEDFQPLGRLLRLDAAPAGRYGLRGTVGWTNTGMTLAGARLSLAGAQLALDGSVAFAPGGAGTELSVELKGSDAGRDARRFGIDGLPAAPYRLAGRVRRQAAATVLGKARLSVVGATLGADGTLGDAPEWRGTRLDIDASGPALERFAALVPGDRLPTGPFRVRGRVERAGARIALRRLDAEAAGSTASGSVAFTLPLASATVDFDVDARGPDLAALLPGVAGEAGELANFTLHAKGRREPGGWSFEALDVATDGGGLDVSGNLAFAPRFATTGLSISGRSRSLRSAGRLLGRDWPDLPAELDARFTGTGTDFELAELRARLGASDVRGRMSVRLRGDVQSIDARLESGVLDLGQLAGRREKRPPAVARSRRGDRDHVVPAVPLGLAALDGYAGRLQLGVRELRLAEGRFGDLRVEATLGRRRLEIGRFAVADADGRLEARLELAEGPGGISARLAGSGTNLALSPIPTGDRRNDAGRFAAEFDLAGNGRDLRELAGTLGGSVRLVGHGGRIPNQRLVTAASGDFVTQLLRSLNPMTTREPTTEVVCVAYLFTAADGVLKTDPALVLQTKGLDIIGHGTVDLRTEKVDFNLKTVARQGLGIGVSQFVNPYIKVAGRLSGPGIVIDPKGAVINGGAAFATAGLSIVATTAWERVFRDKDPCGAAVAGRMPGALAQPRKGSGSAKP